MALLPMLPAERKDELDAGQEEVARRPTGARSYCCGQRKGSTGDKGGFDEIPAREDEDRNDDLKRNQKDRECLSVGNDEFADQPPSRGDQAPSAKPP